MWTQGLSLPYLLKDYKKASQFYQDNLCRRTQPEQLAIDLLNLFCSPDHLNERITRNMTLCKMIEEANVNLPITLLLLLKALPGYESRAGDVTDISQQFDTTLNLLNNFFANETGTIMLPALQRAKDETCRNRLTLIKHFENILDTYTAYASGKNRYELTDVLKRSRVNVDLAGFWNEHGGRIESTEFWQIEPTCNEGTFFMTHWHKDAGDCLTGVRYTLFVLEGNYYDSMIIYIQHPKFMLHHIQGTPYEESDQMWYSAAYPDEDRPDKLILQRMIGSYEWPSTLILTRCSNRMTVSNYEYWLKQGCTIKKPFGQLEYYLRPNLYAITANYLYIATDNEGEFYQIPRDAHEGFECITLNDNVGLMEIDNQVYLAFDELLLYIPTTPEVLRQYGISPVNEII